MGLAFIGLGSNLGNCKDNLLSGWRLLKKSGKVTLLSLSSPYLTEPVGIETDFWFTNAVGVLETSLVPHALLDRLMAIEKEMGRDRSKGIDRTLDLDLLYYDDQVLDSPLLTLPHPEMHNRLFVLAPMAEVSPDHLHPVLLKTNRQLYKKVINSAAVRQESW